MRSTARPRLRLPRMLAVVAAVPVLATACSSEPAASPADVEAVREVDPTDAPRPSVPAGATTSSTAPGLASTAPPSLDGFVVVPPDRFEVAARPDHGTVHLDESGEPDLAMRFFVDRAVGQSLNVTIHAMSAEELDGHLATYEEHEGSVEEIEPAAPYDRLVRLQPDRPDLPASDRQLVAALDDDQVLFVIGDLPWDELTTVLRSAHGMPGSLRVVTSGGAEPGASTPVELLGFALEPRLVARSGDVVALELEVPDDAEAAQMDPDAAFLVIVRQASGQVIMRTNLGSGGVSAPNVTHAIDAGILDGFGVGVEDADGRLIEAVDLPPLTVTSP